jgi:hypothetical protein
MQITESHIKLLKNMIVSWNGVEFGAPTIDPKRPYGNGDVVEDILRILGIPYDGENEALENFARQLHDEMENALQIFLLHGEMKPGVYEKESQYQVKSWVRKE